MTDPTLLEAERCRLQRSQEADRAELDAMTAAPAAGSMADYERARRDVLVEDMAHREAQLRWIAARRAEMEHLRQPLSSTPL